MHPYKAAYGRLFEIASSQQGYFTARQAISAGYADNTHPFHVKAGNWIREQRGIYRLALFSQEGRPDLVLWTLWSRGRDDKPQGVFSHQTALSVYELSDINPAKLHMTVPLDFRRSSPTPKILVLHKAAVHPDDVEARQGFRVTRPLKTVADLTMEGSLSERHIQQATREAFERGLLARFQLRRDRRIPEEIKMKIASYLDKT